MQRQIPRLVLAGTSSGVGKTTTVVALIAALRARKLRVAVFKCGPDYLDPTYHSRAAGVTCHNLDGWMMGRDSVLATFSRATQDADIAIIEGVMGLFDGTSPTGEEGSTAEIAKWLAAPVILVVDASGMARTIGAIAKGFTDFDPGLRLEGLICNRIGSRGHLDLLRQAVPNRIVGGFPIKPELSFPERHLGLRAANKEILTDGVLAEWGAVAAEWLNIDRIVEIARSAQTLEAADSPAPPESSRERCRIGIACDDAFHFYYEDNLARLQSAGSTLVRFSPVGDAQLPDVDGLYIGGGYPEAHAATLSKNSSMLQSIRAFAERGAPIYAECGGLMYLSRAIRTLDGLSHPMVGLLPLEVEMKDRLQALGYVDVETRESTLLGPAGTRFRGQQFRYSEPRSLPHSLGAPGAAGIYTIRTRWGGDTSPEGYCYKSVLGSYVHAHWASNPTIPEQFVSTCAAYRTGQR